MGQQMQDSQIMHVKNPVDSAFLIYSRDISVPDTKDGVELKLNAFQSKSLEEERIQPLESISITYDDAFGEQVATFKTFKEINSFIRELAEHAPLEKEGADRYVIYAEWQNKNGGAFKGFSAYNGFLYVTREMKDASNIAERAIAIRDMFDAGLLQPKAFTEEQSIDKRNLINMFPKDRDYLISALRHMDGLNGQFRTFVRSYEAMHEKQSQKSKKRSKSVLRVNNGQNRDNELVHSGR